jgi:uncharacterized protein (DUF427 family)
MRSRLGLPEPEIAGPGEESVWAYPRPPELAPDKRHVEVRFGGEIIASSTRTVRHLETASPPTFYIPPEDVSGEFLEPADGSSFCEWKGRAVYLDVVAGKRRARQAAWSYPRAASPYQSLSGWLAFYPGRVDECFVNRELVRAQPGPFYGGWITDEIRGPVKGPPGTEWW